LRKPTSLCEHGKSSSLLKFKNMVDAEALVVDVQGFKLLCRLPNKEIIRASKKRNLYVIIGDIVTFKNVSTAVWKKHRTMSMHKIIGVRSDLKWEDIASTSSRHLGSQDSG